MRVLITQCMCVLLYLTSSNSSLCEAHEYYIIYYIVICIWYKVWLPAIMLIIFPHSLLGTFRLEL